MIETVTKYVCDCCGKEKASPSYEDKKKWWKLENDHSAYSNPITLLCNDCREWVIGCIDQFKNAPSEERKDRTVRLGVYR